MGVKTFWLTESPFVERSLRRYVSSSTGHTCPGPWQYHNASVVIERFEKPRPEGGYETTAARPAQFVGDSRWPVKCSCGYVFHQDDEWQVNEERLYSGCPDGKLYTLHDAPPGAMWDAWWYGKGWSGGSDGLNVVARCPNGRDWHVDGPASNCTKPDDHDHRCWTRTGDPRTGVITVGKEYGPTCGAGAGSILAGDYHGFLRNGEFTPNM